MVRLLDGLNIVGADVVEVAPPFDLGGMTALAGATMMFELLCVMAKSVAGRCADETRRLGRACLHGIPGRGARPRAGIFDERRIRLVSTRGAAAVRPLRALGRQDAAQSVKEPFGLARLLHANRRAGKSDSLPVPANSPTGPERGSPAPQAPMPPGAALTPARLTSRMATSQTPLSMIFSAGSSLVATPAILKPASISTSSRTNASSGSSSTMRTRGARSSIEALGFIVSFLQSRPMHSPPARSISRRVRFPRRRSRPLHRQPPPPSAR